MDKFGLGYRLEIEAQDGGLIIVEPPYTIQFSVIRSILSSQSACQIRIYNLNPRTRDRVRFNILDYQTVLKVVLYAGYGGRYASIFQGEMTVGNSFREGVDNITQIECFNGSIAQTTGFTSKTFPAGTPQRAVISDLAASLPETKLGAIGNFEGVLVRPNSYSGSTVQTIQELTGGALFLDDGKANALLDHEYISNIPEIVISPATGLLNTPIREQSIVRFETLFEPQLAPGSRVRIQSARDVNSNGVFKCEGVRHNGIISESVASSVTTLGEYLYTTTPVGVRSAS